MDHVDCPACDANGMVGEREECADGSILFWDYECPLCKGRCYVTKRKANKFKANKEGEK